MLQPNGAASPTTRNGIARVNADGSLDPGFDPNANNSVNCVTLQTDGKILLGGPFTILQPNGAAAPTKRSNVARINGDGTLDTAFDPNAVVAFGPSDDVPLLQGKDYVDGRPAVYVCENFACRAPVT